MDPAAWDPGGPTGGDAIMRCAALVVGMSVVLPSSSARADVIVLKGGGQVQGKVIADPTSKKGDRVQVVLPRGKTPLNLRKDQILEILPKPGPLDEYAARRQKLAPTARADYELGAWCDAHRLPDLAQVHFEAALRRDPEFAEARTKLGHVAKDGRWLTPDEQRREAGMVLHRGKWVTEDEKAREDEQAQESAGSASWTRRIKIILQGLVSESADRRREAEDQLMELKDPEAVGPLVKVLGGQDADVRILLARALGAIPGDPASKALVDMVLREPEDHVRASILEPLRRREGNLVPSRLTRALKSPDVRVINRAAWALGNLDAFASVPRLLDVLITVEQRVELVPSGGPAYSGPPGALMAFNGSSAAYLTGPVVGPGVAAFGATVVPNTFALDPFNGGAPITFGDGMGPRFVGADKGPQPQLMTFTSQNVEVLAALNRLTGQDFGYDVDAWRAWVSRSFNPKPVPDRKAPQP